MTSPTTHTVCIVDDDVQVRRFLVEILASIGLIAEEYASGEDFMRRWQPGGTGCVLLDIRMPRITGPEIHDWLRQQSPDVPVIFLSGYADVPTAVRAMRLGAFDFSRSRSTSSSSSSGSTPPCVWPRSGAPAAAP
jgi:two-component system response regulator FixJ